MAIDSVVIFIEESGKSDYRLGGQILPPNSTPIAIMAMEGSRDGTKTVLNEIWVEGESQKPEERIVAGRCRYLLRTGKELQDNQRVDPWLLMTEAQVEILANS